MTDLAAGASAGVTNTASSAIRDAYAELADLLARLLTGCNQARQALDAQKTEPTVLQARVGDDLTPSGAARRGDPPGHEPPARVG